jgi:hypothetical protein
MKTGALDTCLILRCKKNAAFFMRITDLASLVELFKIAFSLASI